ncbi:LETM1 and EF-hand domain-containing protein 1, mitochondrial [Leucoagaricus sp. SymC.cos]|nr:LETM1 and EF-hand domain-containing protein 1, mitochondrial [Leucoagaricus sp. SymC.cos]
MSLWLPASSAALRARPYSRLSPLLLRPYAHSHRAFLPTQRRFQSTQPPPQSSSTSTLSDETKSSPPAPKEAPQAPLGTRIWKKVKHEAQHYWHGSKLLVSEVRISSRLQWKILHGETLTRRERRQLKRTTQDLLRLVPFAVFVIVPFMELLLPVALKLFPNMLPSTFEDKFAAEEKQRKLLRVRLDMAKFLQETLRESGLRANAHIVGSDAFKEFFRKVRSTGEAPSAQDVINVAKLFDDDLTLDNLSRPQLVSMSRYMGLNAFGTDNFLRGTIRTRLVNLRRDDQLIDSEGVDELSVSELQAACQSRGIRTSGVSPARLREELMTWIQLHLHNRVSGVLLVLGRAFQFDRKPGEDEDGKTAIIMSLENVLCGLPDNLLNEADKSWRSCSSRKNSLRTKRNRNKKKRMQDVQPGRPLSWKLAPPKSAPEADNTRMTTEQLKELAEALSICSSKSSVLKERAELAALMEENLQAEEDPKSPSGALTKRIRSMITKIDSQLQEYDAKVGNSLQMISADAQGRIPVADLEIALDVIKHKPDEEVTQAVIQKLDVDKDGFVELEHVVGLVKEEGLGTLIDDEAQSIIGQGNEIKNSKPRKEDIVHDQ